jgi:hypothetical protein
VLWNLPNAASVRKPQDAEGAANILDNHALAKANNHWNPPAVQSIHTNKIINAHEISARMATVSTRSQYGPFFSIEDHVQRYVASDTDIHTS